MKKIIAVISAATIFIGTPAIASNDAVPPTVAIIDTAFDAALFGNSVIEEVCITAGAGCNNRTGFQIGAGSSGANIVVKDRDLENWVHGNLMAKTVLEANPNAKLLLIRNAKVYGNAVLSGTEKDFSAALSWLIENSKKYNVVAISFSRGSHSYVTENKQATILTSNIKLHETMITRLKANRANPRILAPLERALADFRIRLSAIPAPVCPNTNDIRAKIISLQSNNIPTIVATGNDADKSYVDYPACVEESISVTAHNGSSIVHIGNTSLSTDFAAQAITTSEATAKLAGIWSLVNKGSYALTYDFLRESGIKSGNISLVP